MSTADDVRGWLAARSGTDADDWFLVSKARHGMEVLLSAVAACRGPGTVVTQPFTCITAVNPILAAGLTPAWAETSPATLSLDVRSLPRALSPATRAVVVQHTFGPVADVSSARAAVPAGVVIVEDSAHALGTVSRAADVSVHSFGLDKMLPTRAGGAVWVNPAIEPALGGELIARLSTLPAPTALARVAFRATPPIRRAAGRLGVAGHAAFDLLARAGLVDPSIHPAEERGVNVGPATALGGPALAAVAASLPRYDSIRAHRRTIAASYREALARAARVEIPAAFARDVPLVRFPVLLRDAESASAAFTLLDAAGVEPGDWYRPTLCPGPKDPGRYGYDPAATPVATDLSQRVLNLPTAPFVTQELARSAVAALQATA